jgi:4-hydroxybenzoate polyprenyltransferase
MKSQSKLISILMAMRPKQWTKNVLLFAGLYFSRNLLDPVSVQRALAGFVVFCLLSGAMYMLNDVIDRDKDRLHPRKCNRPIAAGVISVPLALGAAALA